MHKISYYCPMPSPIHLRLHQQLNDFLSPELRDTVISQPFTQSRSVKDLVESIGIPHPEIDLIIINGAAVDDSYQLQGGEHISLYPALTQPAPELQNITPLFHCQPEPLTEPRFVLDVHLGRLAAYLRMTGFDSLYRNDYPDHVLADISAGEDRILLTCDLQLLMRKIISRGYFVRARQPQQQLLEVFSRFDLYNRQKPLTRCMHCNGKIRAVDKHKIEDQLQAKTRKYYSDFFQCETCRKIYWKGSHYLKMQTMINSIKAGTGIAPPLTNEN